MPGHSTDKSPVRTGCRPVMIAIREGVQEGSA